MRINLLEIPEEGKSWICNQKTAELNESLKDLIGKKPYSTEFTIRPLQSGTYELTGFIRTEIPEDCSRCGVDFDMPLDEKFKELLIPEQPLPRNSKYTKANHLSDMHEDQLSVIEYPGHHFEAGEYLHEVVGLAEPLIPAPPCDAQGNCTKCSKNVKDMVFKYEDQGFETPEQPFSVLKNIKLS
jgi:uncharacterized protein